MKECNWIPAEPAEKDFKCKAKFRYRQEEQGVTVHIGKDGITVDFDEKQRAITEGQFCVFYDDEKCLGGGIIEKAIF